MGTVIFTLSGFTISFCFTYRLLLTSGNRQISSPFPGEGAASEEASLWARCLWPPAPRLAVGSKGEAGPGEGNVVMSTAFARPPPRGDGTSLPLTSIPALFLMEIIHLLWSSKTLGAQSWSFSIHSPRGKANCHSERHYQFASGGSCDIRSSRSPRSASS